MEEQKTLHAIYDLAVNPITFDIQQFVSFAHVWARSQRFYDIHLHIVYPPYSSKLGGHVWRMATPKDKTLTPDEKYQRIETIMMPFWTCTDMCSGMSMWENRQTFHYVFCAKNTMAVMFPPHYEVNRPTSAVMMEALHGFTRDPSGKPVEKAIKDMICLRAPKWAVNEVERESVDLSKTILIKTRRSLNEEHRNSDIEMWEQVEHRLLEKGYYTKWLDDSTHTPLPILLAYMQQCAITITDAGGPGLLPFYTHGASCLLFWQLREDKKVTIAQDQGISQRESLARLAGVEVNGQPPQARDDLAYVWEDELTSDLIVDRTLKALEKKGA